jgi:flavorubredoxin
VTEQAGGAEQKDHSPNIRKKVVFLLTITKSTMTQTISPAVRYIGVDDKNLDLFESQYLVPEGMSYNSYVILDDKIAVLDTSDARTAKVWMRNLEEALDGRRPDYLIVHHMEPDHSACAAALLEKYPSLTLVATAAAIKMLPQFFPGAALEGRTRAVAEGDTLELGAHTLRFIAAPMVHWPEVMMSLEESEKILFSADAFGKFGALELTGGLWCTPDTDWACEARRYYFNICGKYGPQVQRVLDKMAPLGVQTVCPLHGPLLRDTLAEALDLYTTWSSYGVETPGVFVAYASIHGGTAEAAERFAQMLRDKGCPKVATTDLTRDDLAEAIEDAFRYKTLVVAAASYDAGLFPPMHDFLWHLQIKGWQHRRAAVIENGSWAPTAGRVMTEMLSAMKDVEIVGQKVTIRSRLQDADIPALEALADAVLDE